MDIPGPICFYCYALQFSETKLAIHADGYDTEVGFISSPHYLI
jgi:hypothetical protein